jgi:hypothetical protein
MLHPIVVLEMVKIQFLIKKRGTICMSLSFVLLPICDNSSTLKVIFLCTRGDVVFHFVVGDCEDQNEVL